MKVKVTATATVEIDLNPEDYSEGDEPLRTLDQVIAFELQQANDDPNDSLVIDYLTGWGSQFSDIKIEKVEEIAAQVA